MGQLQVKIIPVTPFQQNCALIMDSDTKAAAIVDPGGEAPRIAAEIMAAGADVRAIYLTHGHLDHAGGADALARRLGVKLIGPDRRDEFLTSGITEASLRYGAPGMEDAHPDEWLEDGQTIDIAGHSFDVVHCPGHTPGHVVFLNRAENFAVLGDVLFRNSVGRTDFPDGYGNHEELIDGIKTKLMTLPDEVRFICGHGPASSIGAERRSNPFLK